MKKRQVVIEDMSREEFFTELRKTTEEAVRRANAKKWLSKQEAMELLDVSESTLKRYRDKGYIRHSRHGRKIVYERDSINEFLEQNAMGGNHE